MVVTEAVGAAAGGLVRHGHNGLVVPAGDVRALAGALERLFADPGLRRRLGAEGRIAVRGHSYQAWSAGVSSGLAAVGASRAVVA